MNNNNNDFEAMLVEGNLTVWWLFTETKKGCLNFVDAMHDVQYSFDEGTPAFNLVKDARDLAFTKGQLMHLLDNQQKYFLGGE